MTAAILSTAFRASSTAYHLATLAQRSESPPRLFLAFASRASDCDDQGGDGIKHDLKHDPLNGRAGTDPWCRRCRPLRLAASLPFPPLPIALSHLISTTSANP